MPVVIPRRRFLKSAAVMAAAATAGSSFSFKGKPLLSFSTLGCPDWSFEQIINFAELNKYDGIELRVIQRQLDLIKCKEFSSTGNINDTLRKMADRNLRFVNLGSSCTLHFAEGAERTKQLDEGKRFIDLAAALNCPNIRVFPNNFPKDQEKEKTMEFISKGLLELAEHAKETRVMVLMETHGDVVYINDVERIMQNAVHAHTGLVWDFTNMWTITKEAPVQAYSRLKQYIHHVHVKDANMVDNKPQYTLLGKGVVPVKEALNTLIKNEYKGYYSFEWEKLWHPEIEAPETALADYPVSVKKYFQL
ncbi:MAG: sugar phosphate isomerase/epimerase [Ferruginibacter sp.]